MNVALAMRNVRVHRGELELLSDVSLELRTGRCLAIVGETGAGKSLACRALVGSLGRIGARLTGGQVVVGDVDMTKVHRAELRRMRREVLGFVPQASLASLNPVRSVGRQLAEAWRVRVGGRPAEADLLEVLASVELRDRSILRSYSHELSGGMRQRVAIALAVLSRPRILIADEPTTALDVTVQAEVMDLLADLRDRLDMSVVLVTHDLGVVADHADDVAVLYAGMTVEAGPTTSLLRAPAHPYTAALIGAQPVLGRPGTALKAIPGAPPSPASWPSGCRFVDRCGRVTDDCHLHVPPMVQATATEARCLNLMGSSR